MKATPIIVFILIGAAVWSCAGFVTCMGSFEYTGPVSKDMSQEDRDVFMQYSNLAFTGFLAWTLAGGAAGVLVFLWFVTRPDYLHGIPAPSFSGGPGPKTVAEMHTVPVAFIIGLAGGFLLSHFYIPSIDLPARTVLREGTMRDIIGTVSTGLLTVCVLPISKSIITRIATR